MRVFVVIPAYNEAATIADVAGRACRFADRVVVIDDGSTDGTGEAVAGLPLTVLRHPHNRGKGASLWDGMQIALSEGATVVVTLDGDGQHRPEDIPTLLQTWRRHTDALVIAARLRHRGRAPRLRRFANETADFWISWAAGCRIEDSQSGFRLYPAALLRRLEAAHDPRRGFVFESEALIEAARKGFRPLSVPVETIYPKDARASHYRPVTDTARIVRMVAWKLLAKGMYLRGLVRSRTAPQRAS